LMNTVGKEMVNADYLKIEKSMNGLYLVQDMTRKWGLLDSKGVTKLSPAFDRLKDLGDNKLLAVQNGKMGLLDNAGKILIPFMFEEVIYNSAYVLLKR
jgi:hypothetical protein